MSKLINLSIFIVTLSFSIIAAAEVTESLHVGPEEGETYYEADAPMACTLKVVAPFNVRQGHSLKDERCATFQSTARRAFGSYEVNAVSLYNNQWVKFTSEETKDCPGGFGWAYKNAFADEDFARFKNGECGRSALDGGRSTPAVTPTNVVSTNSGNHAFPLNKCLGIKNKGGRGAYNSPRNNRGRRYSHTGTDYYAPSGSPILSPCDGKVTSSTYGNVAGNTLVITCKNGDSFKFMHMNSRPRKAAGGTQVRKGTLVGGVGNTGNARSQATQLHVEAVVSGRRVDPQSLWSCKGDSGF